MHTKNPKAQGQRWERRLHQGPRSIQMEVGHSHQGPSPQTRTKAALGWRQKTHQGPSSTPVIVVSVISYSPMWIFLGYRTTILQQFYGHSDSH